MSKQEKAAAFVQKLASGEAFRITISPEAELDDKTEIRAVVRGDIFEGKINLDIELLEGD